MTDLNKEQVGIIDVYQLYPDLERGIPVSSKLRTLLQQIDLKINWQETIKSNSYLERLLKECQLFFPEIFDHNWQKNWDTQLACQLEKWWIKSVLDVLTSNNGFDNERVIIIDWSGLKVNPIATAQAYMLCQKLNLAPTKISIISLTANKLVSDLNIDFTRRKVFTNDLVICKQELESRIEILRAGRELRLALFKESETKPSDENILLEIENIPEITLE